MSLVGLPGKMAKANHAKKPSLGGTVSLTDGDHLDSYLEPALPEEQRVKLHKLFREIEKEFEKLHAENIKLRGQVEAQTDRNMERGMVEHSDLDSVKSAFAKNKGQQKEPQKFKPGHRLKAQTSKIVSSFKGPSFSCSVAREFRGHRDGIWEVAVKAGMPFVGTASADFTAAIWSVDNSRCLLQYQGHRGSVNSIKFHPSRDLVLTASGDHTCHVWPLAVSPEQLKAISSEDELDSAHYLEERIQGGDDLVDYAQFCATTIRTNVCELVGHKNVVIAADWLNGGDQVIAASWDRTAILYDVTTTDLLHTLSGHDEELTYVSAHPKNRLALTSSKDTTFRLWDFRDIQTVCVFQGHVEAVNCAVFAGEDKIVSGSDDKTVKIWDLKNMRTPLHVIRLDSAANRLSVSNLNHIAVPTDNRNVHLFDINGQRLGRIPRNNRQGHRRMVCSTAWTDESVGQKCNLLSSGFDKEVLGWTVQAAKDSKD